MTKKIYSSNKKSPHEIVLPRLETIEGDYEAMRDLLSYLSQAIRQGIPLHPIHAEYLANALSDISDGADPKTAFRIRRKRGQKDTREAVTRAVGRAYKVALRLKEKPELSVEDAIAEVAEEEKAPEETVKAAWRDYRKSVELIDSGWAYVRLEKVK